MRRSTESSSIEDSKHIKDILSLPDIPRNIPKMVSALRQLDAICVANSVDPSSLTLDTTTDLTTSKTSTSVTTTERRSMEMVASLVDESLNISNITDGIVRAVSN
jgi:hypothetical protein